ncbi:hypothetical protein [Streptomyces sp. NPDC059616]|uniref:hypothetical protein n=1 Tax=Streptomyces sp. NPDC059616 TaxID=3346886 RepID=UPI00367CEA3D
MHDGDADDTSEPLPGTINSKIIPGRSVNVTTPPEVYEVHLDVDFTQLDADASPEAEMAA